MRHSESQRQGETERGTEIETKADRERHRGTDIDRLREILKYVIKLKKLT